MGNQSGITGGGTGGSESILKEYQGLSDANNKIVELLKNNMSSFVPRNTSSPPKKSATATTKKTTV